MVDSTYDLILDDDHHITSITAPPRRTAFKKKVIKTSASRRPRNDDFSMLDDQVQETTNIPDINVADDISMIPSSQAGPLEQPTIDEPMPDITESILPSDNVFGTFNHDFSPSALSIKQQATELLTEYKDKHNYDDGAHRMFGTSTNCFNEEDDSNMPDIKILDDMGPSQSNPWNLDKYDFELDTDEELAHNMVDPTDLRPPQVRLSPPPPISSILERLRLSRSNLTTNITTYTDQIILHKQRIQELSEKLASLGQVSPLM